MTANEFNQSHRVGDAVVVDTPLGLRPAVTAALATMAGPNSHRVRVSFTDAHSPRMGTHPLVRVFDALPSQGGAQP